MQKIISHNEAETFALGLKLGQACQGGESFFLQGDLGAGKTKLIQGLAKGLGINDRVNSPTFNILKIYPLNNSARGIRNFCHIDAYRLQSAQELINLGVEEFLGALDTVSAVEWADKVEAIRPATVRLIIIKALSKNSREITIV